MRPLTADPAERPMQTEAKPRRKAVSSKERTMPRQRRLRRTRQLVLLAFAAALIGGGIQAVRVGWHQDVVAMLDRGLDAAYRGVGLEVTEVTISGRLNARPETLREALGVALHDPILRLDLAELRRRVESVGWVRSATVSRHLPGRLHVALVERQPFMRWQHDGRTALIDAEGALIMPEVGSDYGHLPRIVGADANARALELVDLLAASPELAADVVTATLIRKRRWDIGLRSGITVRLPEEDADEAWMRLGEVQRRDRLLEQQVVAVDLRVPGRVIVQPRPVGADAVNPERET